MSVAEVEGLKELLGDLEDDQSTIDEEFEGESEPEGHAQDDPVRRV